MKDKREQQTIRMFDKEAAIYDDTYNGRHAQKAVAYVYQRLIDHMGQAGTLLDVGCGTGTLIHRLSCRYEGWKFTGVDLSRKMLEICRKGRKATETFLFCPADQLSFEDESFCIVTCTDSFHHYVNAQQALSEMYRVLNKGGELIICEIWLPGIIRQITNAGLKIINTGDVRIYGKRTLTEMLEAAGFCDIDFQVLSPMMYQCIARKRR